MDTASTPPSVICPACGKQHHLPPNLAGKKVRCSCGAAFTTPAPQPGAYDLAPIVPQPLPLPQSPTAPQPVRVPGVKQELDYQRPSAPADRPSQPLLHSFLALLRGPLRALRHRNPRRENDDPPFGNPPSSH